MRGYSLFELTVSILILMTMLGVIGPTFHRMVENSKAASGINWIIRAINITRISAVDFGSLTTLCPTNDSVSCGGDWHGKVMVFTDPNDNRRIDNGERLVATLLFPHEGSTLKWRSFRNRQYLQMTSEGYTNFQNGNFVYCSQNKDPLFARQIVLNPQGRVKKSSDRNDDGLVEDIYGQHLRC